MAVGPETKCSLVFQLTDFMTPYKEAYVRLDKQILALSTHKAKCSHFSIYFPLTDL